MTVHFVTSGLNVGMFNRLGAWFWNMGSANVYSGVGDLSASGLDAVGVAYSDIIKLYEVTLPYIHEGMAQEVEAARASLRTWKNSLLARATQSMVDQVHADANLKDKNPTEAMRELFKQMKASSQSVQVPTVLSAAAAPVAGNVGNGVVTASLLRPDGTTSIYPFNEVMDLTITGGTARTEAASVRGATANTDPLSWDWPKGSGYSGQVSFSDAAKNNSGNNLLYNSSFNTFSVTDQPDFWGLPLTGAYGVDIREEIATVYRSGTKCLRFIGQGTPVLSSIAQAFAQTPGVAASGTSAKLKPNTVYAAHCWVRKSAGLLAGALELTLLGPTNTQIQSDALVDQKMAVAHGAVSPSAWTPWSGFFVTPKTLLGTDANKLCLRVTTGLTSGQTLYVADLAFREAAKTYEGGPWLGAFAGNLNFLAGDKYLVTVNNNYSGKFVQWFDRSFGARALGLQVPTSASPTIPDSLIGPV